ncbi:MAG: M1 family peptidase, partial [Flavobacterium sp.]|nr:M1 family peptidase [Flavobacterium sp.]
VILDGYLGVFSTAKAPMKITFTEKNNVLSAEISGYPKFNLEVAGKDLFESKRAGVKFQFNEDKTALEMIISDGQKIPFTKDK